jgi:hypothetical protein
MLNSFMNKTSPVWKSLIIYTVHMNDSIFLLWECVYAQGDSNCMGIYYTHQIQMTFSHMGSSVHDSKYFTFICFVSSMNSPIACKTA